MTSATMSSDLAIPGPLTTRQVLWWWELRRPIFNLVVMMVGFCSIASLNWIVAPLLPEDHEVVDPTSLILVSVVYGVLINLCYTLGWILELRERKSDEVAARVRGRLLFHLMFAFSLILATGPFFYACAFWLMHRGAPN